MNNYISVISLILLSVLFVSIQSTLLSPLRAGYMFPDLNLILIVFLSLSPGLKGNFLMATGNGYLMDVLSGNLPGTFTISRLSTYLLIRTGSGHIFLRKIVSQAAVIFSATIFSWTFIYVVFKIREEAYFTVSFKEIMTQAVVNTLVGVPLIWLIGKFYAKLQD